MRADAPSARQILVEVLLKIGLKHPSLADDLDVSGFKVDDGGRLMLPEGYLNGVKRQFPHWFKERRRTYRDPDKLRHVLYPEFRLPNS